MLLKRLQNLIGEGRAALPAQWLWLAPMLVFIKFAGSLGRAPLAVAENPPDQPEDADTVAEDTDGAEVAAVTDSSPGNAGGITIADADNISSVPIQNPSPADGAVSPSVEEPADGLIAELQEIGLSDTEDPAAPIVNLVSQGSTDAAAPQSQTINIGGVSITLPANVSAFTSGAAITPAVGAGGGAGAGGSDADAGDGADAGSADAGDPGAGPGTGGGADAGENDSNGGDSGSGASGADDPGDPGDGGGTGASPPVNTSRPELAAGRTFQFVESNSPFSIGTVKITDPDGTMVVTGVELMDDQNGLFAVTLQGNNLVLATTSTLEFDDLAPSNRAPGGTSGFTTLELEVFAFDDQGKGAIQTLTLTIEENQAPLGVTFSSDSVAEGATIGSTIAFLDAVDSNTGGAFTFEIVDDPDGVFRLGGADGSVLQVATDLDVETNVEHAVTIQVTDQSDETFDQDFVIFVEDVNESRPQIEFDGFFLLPGDGEIGAFGILDVSDADITEIVTSVRLVDDFNGLFSATLVDGDVLLGITAPVDANDLPEGVTTELDPNGRQSIRLQVIVSDDLGDGDVAIVFVMPTETTPPEHVNEPPAANDDTAVITEQSTADDDMPNQIVGNVLTGVPNAGEADTDADTSDVLSVSQVNGSAANVGTALVGFYGAVTINADGSYIYELADANVSVNALKVADSLTDSFNYTASDGNGGTDTATLTITINGINDGPRIDLDTLDRHDVDPTGVIKIVQENSGKTENMLITNLVGATPAGRFAEISDPDSTEMSQMTFSLRAGTFEVGLDELFILAVDGATVLGLGDTVVGNITIQFFSATTIVLGGADTIASYLTALDRLGLDHSGDSPDTDLLRLIDITTEDALGQLSNTAVAEVSVWENNDAPVITSVDTVSAKESTTGSPSSGTLHTVTASDADTADTTTFSITGGADQDLFSVNAITGELTFSTPGTAVPTFENPIDADSDGVYELVVTVTDSGDLTASQLITVTVTPHDGPTGLALTNHSVSEGAALGATVGILSAVNSDAAGTLGFSIVSDPGGIFQIGGDDGNELQIAGVLDAESNLTHLVTVRVTDDGGATSEQQFSINVLDVNESRPEIEPHPVIEVTVDDTIGPLGIFDISDADISKIVTGVRLTDDFAGLFSVSLDNGDAILSLQRAIDFDALPADVFSILNADGSRSVDLKLTASDGVGDGVTETVRVTVDGSFTLWDHVIEELVLDGSNLELIGHDWDNTLVRNVTIRNFDGNGILLQDVDNVRLENVTVEDVAGAGIVYENVSNVHFDEGSIDNTLRGVWVLGAVDSSVENIEISDSTSDGILLHSLQGTENFLISGNTILNSGGSGIAASQDVLANMDNPGLRIIDNVIDNTGLATTGASHGIIVQSQDFHIEGNVVLNSNWGDGIFVSSSGVIIGNVVHTVTSSDSSLGFGIVYFTDHAAGTSDTLLIQNNTLFSDTIGGALGGDIRILGFADNEPFGEVGRVHNFVIVGNTLVTTEGALSRVGVSSDWDLAIDADPIYSFIIVANQITDHASAEIEALFDNVHDFAVLNVGGEAALSSDFAIGFFDQGDSVLLTDVIDFNQDTFISLADIEEDTTVMDLGDPDGALGDVIIQFAGGGSITLGGIGNGTFTSIDDILAAGYDIGLG